MNGRATIRSAVLAASVSILLLSASARGDDTAAKETLALTEWLRLGPVEAALPAFHDSQEKGFSASDLLASEPLPVEDLWPAAGERVGFPGSSPAAWTAVSGARTRLEGSGEQSHLAYLATYLESARFNEAKLTVRGDHLLRIYLDGEEVGERKAAEKSKDEKAKGDEGEPAEPAETTAELVLSTGKHLLLLAAVRDPSVEESWELVAELEVPAKAAGAVTAGTSPRRTLRPVDLLDAETVTGVEVSPDGSLVAVHLRTPAVPADHEESWTEIRDAATGELVHTRREAASFQWAPAGRRFSYTTSDEGKSDLWLADLDTGALTRLVEKVENLGGSIWKPDASGLILSLSEKSQPDERGVKRYRGLPDRWAGWRDRSYLVEVTAGASAGDASSRRLTAGADSTALLDVSPDSRRLLFSITRHDLGKRPFSFGELWELELESLAATKLATVPWFGGAQYGPGGDEILVEAGPSAFGEVGVATPEGTLPNEYDGQLYLLSRSSGEARALTRGFDPSVRQAAWTADGRLVARAEVGEDVGLFLHEGEGFVRLPAAVEAVEGFSAAETGGRVVFWGSSANAPPRVLSASLEARGEPALLDSPAEQSFSPVDFGRVETWDFTSEEGLAITGRVHYPPDFDPARAYPLIVYYYGGTIPESREFGGRYPKNLWAAQGYVVYVPQPSGATGFGQEAAARHVNDWGERTSGEIVRGARELIAAKAFLSAERVGCIGASYGGFMTMYLVTRTDLCTAAVAHAGISSLSSYWGEGWWGYSYSAVASAESYPWNRRDLYVEHSPLFHADEARAPLLLLHGEVDTNVPIGESQQMYTALQVLGKEVELLTFEEENHRVVHYPRRKLWAETIIAWFDRHLKDQPEYWEHLYPKGAG